MAYDIALVAATLACSLVTGLLLGFAVVVMPGIGSLDNRAFVRAFQVADRVIQDRQPVFVTSRSVVPETTSSAAGPPGTGFAVWLGYWPRRGSCCCSSPADSLDPVSSRASRREGWVPALRRGRLVPRVSTEAHGVVNRH